MLQPACKTRTIWCWIQYLSSNWDRPCGFNQHIPNLSWGTIINSEVIWIYLNVWSIIDNIPKITSEPKSIWFYSDYWQDFWWILKLQSFIRKIHLKNVKACSGSASAGHRKNQSKHADEYVDTLYNNENIVAQMYLLWPKLGLLLTLFAGSLQYSFTNYSHQTPYNQPGDDTQSKRFKIKAVSSQELLMISIIWANWGPSYIRSYQSQAHSIMMKSVLILQVVTSVVSAAFLDLDDWNPKPDPVVKDGKYQFILLCLIPKILFHDHVAHI